MKIRENMLPVLGPKVAEFEEKFEQSVPGRRSIMNDITFAIGIEQLNWKK
jgi:hypothetical protein|tara:strand:+ start:577 stop:726 length:150 start_codon:yes stop_codon:yes gene_type:complete